MLLKRFFNFYLFSNIHVALGVYCFCLITLTNFGFTHNVVATFSFFSTVFGYNLIRFTSQPTKDSWIYPWYARHKKLLVAITIITALIAAYLSFKLHYKVLLYITPLAFITIFYGVKIPWLKKGLRYIPGIKIFAIAVVFSGVTVILPLVQGQAELTLEIWWYFLQRLIFVILITLPFDLRDLNTDGGGLKTIPQQFGVFVTKIIGCFLALAIVLIELYFLNNSLVNMVSLLIINSLSLIFLLFATTKQSKYYSAFFIETIPIFWYLLLLIFNL
ncbi:hypothetical protein KH5_02150 [Urechidicola sp. KH5]